jgi:hypothetical protein
MARGFLPILFGAATGALLVTALLRESGFDAGPRPDRKSGAELRYWTIN